MSSQVIVVVPCFNEEKRFPAADFAAFSRREISARFLFVDDGSTDGTFNALKTLEGLDPARFRALRLESNSGKAEAVRQGFAEAMKEGPQFVAYWDADLATPLDELPRMMTVFSENAAAEMVFGSRVKLMGRDIRRSEMRHYLGRLFATAAATALGIGVYDTQCGSKVFRVTSVLGAVFKEPFNSRWIFDVELLFRYLRQKKAVGENGAAGIYEMPLRAWRDVPGSKVRVTDFFRSFFELIKIYFVYRKGIGPNR